MQSSKAAEQPISPFPPRHSFADRGHSHFPITFITIFSFVILFSASKKKWEKEEVFFAGVVMALFFFFFFRRGGYIPCFPLPYFCNRTFRATTKAAPVLLSLVWYGKIEFSKCIRTRNYLFLFFFLLGSRLRKNTSDSVARRIVSP